MNFFTRIKNFIEETSEKNLLYYVIGSLGVIVALLGLLIYWHFSSVFYYKETIRKINNSRKQVRVILNRNKQVEKEKLQVDDMLDQEPDFNLQQYFEQISSNLGIKKDNTSINTATIDRGQYSERNVTATFAGITMKLLTRLLQEIEQNIRINVKELDITPGKSKTIDVTITIATLQKKSETLE